MTGRLLVVAFEGWNDAGEAATGAVGILRDRLGTVPLMSVDPELYYDYQFTRPTVYLDDKGKRQIRWPGATLYGPAPRTGLDEELPELIEDPLLPRSRTDNDSNVYLLLGAEPSRGWQSFVSEVLDSALAHDISRVIVLGAVLADSPHTRPITIECSSENDEVRAELHLERSVYEGPIGILNVLAAGAETVGIPTLSVWASVPHYVHNAPSPKATLALIDKLEELLDIVIPRGELLTEATAWEEGVNALAGEDPDMAGYIRQLEQARDTVEAPEASGEAIAQEFQRYLDTTGTSSSNQEGIPPEDDAQDENDSNGNS
ncbi:PAC2 family protein [Mycetocola spongiae]|uniref:PAC2 family protein n=1 Tax=Mycetocola spongiae TaxID=2859226 RepID=UPI001CF5B63A|nr:PAC2 family protein [Mycetocola spongiae]